MRVIVVLVAAAWSAAALGQVPFTFAVFGDAPYFDHEVPLVRRVLTEMAQAGAVFAVHIGDVKSGLAACSDEVLLDRRALLDSSPIPLVFVPGDNEWSDCHRDWAGAYDPRERLERLRALFFATDESLGQRKLRLTQQSANPRFRPFRENARWIAGNVVFVTLNVPGSNNNLGRNEFMDAEHAERMTANFAWLDEAIKLAREPRMLGLVVLMHADPHFGKSPRRTDGYAGLRDALRLQAAGFAKPLLLVHGDGHRFKIDQPLRDEHTGAPLTHFTRVEVFGSPVVGWVSVDVAPDSARLFTLTGHNGMLSQ